MKRREVLYLRLSNGTPDYDTFRIQFGGFGSEFCAMKRKVRENDIQHGKLEQYRLGAIAVYVVVVSWPATITVR